MAAGSNPHFDGLSTDQVGRLADHYYNLADKWGRTSRVGRMFVKLADEALDEWHYRINRPSPTVDRSAVPGWVRFLPAFMRGHQ